MKLTLATLTLLITNNEDYVNPNTYTIIKFSHWLPQVLVITIPEDYVQSQTDTQTDYFIASRYCNSVPTSSS